jgi:hypothetical protein
VQIGKFHQPKGCGNTERRQKTYQDPNIVAVHREDTKAECYCSGVSGVMSVDRVLTLDENFLGQEQRIPYPLHFDASVKIIN